MPLLSLQAVSKYYAAAQPVLALQSVELDLCAGEHISIVGPSGSGKSTLLNIVGLLDRPTSGRYLIDGVDVESLSERERTAIRARVFGFVFQRFHLVEYRTAFENVQSALVFIDPSRRSRRSRAGEALEQVGLADRMQHLPAELSGGERQRVAIARAIAARPAVLLCDEPTGNLDTATGGAVLDQLEAFHNAGMALVVVTHQAYVADRARRVLTVVDGVLGEGAAP